MEDAGLDAMRRAVQVLNTVLLLVGVGIVLVAVGLDIGWFYYVLLLVVLVLGLHRIWRPGARFVRAGEAFTHLSADRQPPDK